VIRVDPVPNRMLVAVVSDIVVVRFEDVILV